MGASGHGSVIKDLAKQSGCYEEIAFLDDDVKLQKAQDNVIGNSNYAILHKNCYDVIVAVGNSEFRKKLLERYEAAGVSIITLIHPSAEVAEEVEIGAGTVVMAGAVIQPGSILGQGVIVNTGSTVDHECKIGDCVHIAVGSHLAGNVTVGSGTWIGAGAVVSNNISICDTAMIGAGAVVVNDIAESGTYVGVPVRKIK